MDLSDIFLFAGTKDTLGEWRSQKKNHATWHCGACKRTFFYSILRCPLCERTVTAQQATDRPLVSGE